jgi:glycosyltransferase involved in cell wall biosynthesis
MRVAIVLPGFCANEDDLCIPVITTFVREMSSHADVIVITPHYPFAGTTYTVHGIPVHSLSTRKEKGLRRFALWRRVIATIEREHANQRLDLVHAFWANEPGMLAARAARRLNIPSVVSIAGGELAREDEADYGSQLSLRHRLIVNRALIDATVITAGSDWIATRVDAKHRDKLHVVPLGIDLPQQGVRVRTGDRMLAAASMIAVKDYPTLLHSFARARRVLTGGTLTIAGEGVEREKIVALIGELGLRDVVTLRGFVDPRAMGDLYREHDLFLHASRYEAEGMVLIEALATGMPIVSTAVGIAPSLPSSCVRMVAPRDVEGLSAAIVAAVGEKALAESAATIGPDLVAREYSTQVVGERFRELYRSTIRAVG